MKLLVLAPYYPHADYLFSGIFNERCACALAELCEVVDVFVPRPFAPPVISSLLSRWCVYRRMVRHESRNGLQVYRPCYLQIPGFGGAFWVDPGMFFWCHRTIRSMHERVGYDAIVSFDLLGVGGLAWRVGRALGIPASGWAVGGDVRFPLFSSHGRVVLRAIKNLDLIFYQSHELLEKAAELLGLSPGQMSKERHVVLPRGIPEPPFSPQAELRRRVRAEWEVKENQTLIMSVGRIVRDKGVFELLQALALAITKDPSIVCVLIGSNPAFDETPSVQKALDGNPLLRQHVKLLPSCSPEKVWEYLCAADIFAFPSHEEGMPNSLLEAMAMGVPSIAFSIPAVLEIEAEKGGVVAVPPLDSGLFSEAILRLAAGSDERMRIGQKGRSIVMDRFMVKKSMAAALERVGQLLTKHRSQANQKIAERSILGAF